MPPCPEASQGAGMTRSQHCSDSKIFPGWRLVHLVRSDHLPPHRYRRERDAPSCPRERQQGIIACVSDIKRTCILRDFNYMGSLLPGAVVIQRCVRSAPPLPPPPPGTPTPSFPLLLPRFLIRGQPSSPKHMVMQALITSVSHFLHCKLADPTVHAGIELNGVASDQTRVFDDDTTLRICYTS